MPLPAGLPLATVIDALDPAKDVDGIHPRNAGLLALGYDGFLPTTAHAAVEILQAVGDRDRRPARRGRRAVERRRQACGDAAAPRECDGHRLPLATRAICAAVYEVGRHRRGRSRATGTHHRRHASAGAPSSWMSASTWSRVGSSATSTSSRRAGWRGAITPVPGGVGPVTNALLLTHVMRAPRVQARPRSPSAPRIGCRGARGPPPRSRPDGERGQAARCPRHRRRTLAAEPRPMSHDAACRAASRSPSRSRRGRSWTWRATSGLRDDEVEQYGPTKAKVQSRGDPPARDARTRAASTSW